MKHRENLLLLGIGVLLILVGQAVIWSWEAPQCLKNTDDVIAWAEANGIQVNCAAGCDFAVNEYLKAHNLTPEEFPTCCWAADDPDIYMRLTLGSILQLGGFVAVVMGTAQLTWNELKKVVRRVEDDEMD